MNPTDIELCVRPAQAGDLIAVSHLYKDLDDSHQVLDVTLRLRDEDGRGAHIAHALRDPKARFAVAFWGDQVIGFILASFAHRRPDVIIEALAVGASFRRRGVGTELVRDVEQWAKDSSARFVELDVYEFNPEAVAFYKGLGYFTTSRTMRKEPVFKFPEI
jgi:GNAT superfamily N-acetyltransferase